MLLHTFRRIVLLNNYFSLHEEEQKNGIVSKYALLFFWSQQICINVNVRLLLINEGINAYSYDLNYLRLAKETSNKCTSICGHTIESLH